MNRQNFHVGNSDLQYAAGLFQKTPVTHQSTNRARR